MESELPTVNVRLWHADAVVLFDWLMSTDLDAVPITHPAQKQALVDLLSRLEADVDADIAGSTSEEIAAAQAGPSRRCWASMTSPPVADSITAPCSLTARLASLSTCYPAATERPWPAARLVSAAHLGFRGHVPLMNRNFAP
ncbi:hypothetical protein [Streptomyces sp. NPDC005251]|uniref:hypothetical protein n=1 Tax=unclassified Streptomyces TaxID=2593676 RepID=UPI0033B87C4A